MKKTAIFIAAIMFGTPVFANQAAQHSAGKLEVLGSLFKSQETANTTTANNTKIVYAGEDVSRQMILAGNTLSG